jgi:hypothetical protein
MSDTTFEFGGIDQPDLVMLAQLQECSETFGVSVPDAVHQAALAAFSWRSIDEELAALLSDSADSDRLVGARATLTGMRLLEFVSRDGQITLGLSESGLMTGTLTGYSGPQAELVSAQGHRVELLVDEFGEFLCAEIPTGPVRLELRSPTARIVTDWILPPR